MLYNFALVVTITRYSISLYINVCIRSSQCVRVNHIVSFLLQMRIGQESDNEEEVLVNAEPVSPESSPPPRKTVSESSDSTIQDINRLSDSCFETPSESDSVPELLPSTGAPAIRKQVCAESCSTCN